MDYIPRTIGQRIKEAAEFFPAVVLTGARQTGKTTLLRSLFPDHNYVTLDRPVHAEQAEVDPESFLKNYPPPVIIDEVQYAPSLFRFLKIAIDENRHQYGHFLLTGSQKFTLMKGVTESLAGRCALLELEGLSVSEIATKVSLTHDLDCFVTLLMRGGFPELWVNERFPVDQFLDSYIATYLERDVRQIQAIANLRDFERFLRALAIRSSQQLNKSTLAREVGVSVTTIGDWLSIVEALGHVVFLEPWLSNLGKRLVKAPKVYFADPALACALAGLNKDSLSHSPLIGGLWETFVFAELRKQWAFQGKPGNIWYYRDQAQVECDFVLESGMQLSLLECKWTSSPLKKHGANLAKVAAIFAAARSDQMFKVKELALISRASADFVSDGLRICSPLDGIQKLVAGL